MFHQALLSLLALTPFLTPVLAADYAFSTTLPINSIPDSQKNDWCTRHVETCDQVCNKGTTDKDGNEVDNHGVKLNKCFYTTLEYYCYCNRQNDRNEYAMPRMEYFHYSVPGLMCKASLDLCRQTFKDDEDMKKQCDEKIGKKCGRIFTKQQYTKERKLADAWAKGNFRRREVVFEG